MLPAFVKVRVHSGRRVESDHAGGQEKREVVGAELYCLCALLPVRPFDCECGGETVALQIDAVAPKPQWVVHGYFLVFPGGGIRIDLVTDRIGHVRTEGIRLAVREIVGGKVMYIQAVGVQAGAVEKQPGAEGIKIRGGGIAKLGVDIVPVGCDDDDLSFVVHHAADGHGDEHAHKPQVEEQIIEFPAVAFFGRKGALSGAVFFFGICGKMPAFEQGGDVLFYLWQGFVYGAGGVKW